MHIVVYAAFETRKERIIRVQPFWRSQVVCFDRIFLGFCFCSSLHVISVLLFAFCLIGFHFTDEPYEPFWDCRYTTNADRLYVQGGTRSMLCIYLNIALVPAYSCCLNTHQWGIQSPAMEHRSSFPFNISNYLKHIYCENRIIISTTNQFPIYFLSDPRRGNLSKCWQTLCVSTMHFKRGRVWCGTCKNNFKILHFYSKTSDIKCLNLLHISLRSNWRSNFKIVSRA